MDLFFKMEGVRGVLTALHSRKTLTYAIRFGKDTSAIAVQIWNKHREYQVHRWERTAWDFIDREIQKGLNA